MSERPTRAKRAPRAPDEPENLSANTRYDDAWFNKRWPGVGSELTDQQKRDKEKVRLWKEGQVQKEIDDARCNECKKKTVSDPANPIIICNECVGGALHFSCTKFTLKAIPGEDEDVSYSWPVILAPECSDGSFTSPSIDTFNVS